MYAVIPHRGLSTHQEVIACLHLPKNCIVVSTLERKKHIDPIEKALKGRLCRPFGKAKAI